VAKWFSFPAIQDMMLSMTHAEASTPSPSKGARTVGSSRILALDAARAAAIVGMIAVNVGPRHSEGLAGLVYELPAGRASLLFMILAGVGMSIMSRSSRTPGGRVPWATILWRAALLVVGGLALQLMHHEVSVILPTYGLLFLVCLPVLRRSAKTLAVLTVLVLLGGPILWLAAQGAWGQTYQFVPPTILDGPVGILRGILLSGSYPAVVWAAPFMAGLLIGRANLRNLRVQRLLVFWGLGAAAGGYLLSRLLIVVAGEPGENVGMDRLVSAVDHSQMPLWLVSGTGSAAFVLGLFLVGEGFVARRLGFLVPAGRLSLTIYVGHLVILAMLVRPEPHFLIEGIVITASLSVLSILFAGWWTRRFTTGPLEMLLHWPRIGRFHTPSPRGAGSPGGSEP